LEPRRVHRVRAKYHTNPTKILVNKGSGVVVASQAFGHEGDHGPLDHRGVVLREAFVVADGLAASADPGEHPLGRLSAVQDHGGGLPGELGHEQHGQLQPRGRGTLGWLCP